MNIKLITERLHTLKITYDPEKKAIEKGILPENIAGAYVPELNHIYIEGVKNFSETDLRIFIHEFGHVLQISSKGNAAEPINVIFQREVLSKLIEMRRNRS